MAWKLQKVEGTEVTDIGSLPSHMSVAEVETTLQRLVCTRLTEEEVIAASLRKEMGAHSDLLERVDGGVPSSFGHGDVQFIAKKEADEVQGA